MLQQNSRELVGLAFGGFVMEMATIPFGWKVSSGANLRIYTIVKSAGDISGITLSATNGKNREKFQPGIRFLRVSK